MSVPKPRLTERPRGIAACVETTPVTRSYRGADRSRDQKLRPDLASSSNANNTDNAWNVNFNNGNVNNNNKTNTNYARCVRQ